VKILYVSQYYPPEMGAPAARASELAHHWALAGHDVSVLTGFPNHPTGVVPDQWRPRLRRLAYREKVDGVTVYRTWLWPLPNRKAHERMRNYASFCLSAALRGLTLPRPDVIIASSPQLLVGLSGWWLSFTRRVPLVFEVRDLWPESLVAVGAGQENSLLHTALSKIARFLYERANLIAVVTPAFKEHLIRRWRVPAGKIEVIENGVETDLFKSADVQVAHAVRADLGAESRFMVCYVGTMGMAHGLETLLDAAATLQRENPKVLFLLVGEGAEKERIKALASSRQLANVKFLDQQPREKIPALISASDACLVLLKKTDVFKTVIPTKMLEFMSCERPVILAVDGQARQIVEEAGAGLVIEPENAASLAQAILQLSSNPELREVFGKKGRSYIVEKFSRSRTAERYIEVLSALIDPRRD
jgi:glycosyltransferase involved in cell wall biosynthesis